MSPPPTSRLPVAVVSFAQAQNVRRESERNEVEMLMPVVAEVFGNIGITKDDVGFICSGSTDYLVGGPFSFVTALDAVGVWPPRAESHVEMDGAFALYEAWVLLQEGEIDAALVYAFGRSSPGDLQEILCPQLDPYYLGPLWPDPISLAALQARALIDAGKATEEDLAPVAARNRGRPGQPQGPGGLRPHGRGAAGRGLRGLPAPEAHPAPADRRRGGHRAGLGDKAREWSEHPAWITGIDHRVETHSLGARDLTVSPSTTRAAAEAGVADGPSTWPSSTPPTPTRRSSWPRPWGWATGCRSTRRAGRWPPTRS